MKINRWKLPNEKCVLCFTLEIKEIFPYFDYLAFQMDQNLILDWHIGEMFLLSKTNESQSIGSTYGSLFSKIGRMPPRVFLHRTRMILIEFQIWTRTKKEEKNAFNHLLNMNHHVYLEQLYKLFSFFNNEKLIQWPLLYKLIQCPIL